MCYIFISSVLIEARYGVVIVLHFMGEVCVLVLELLNGVVVVDSGAAVGMGIHLGSGIGGGDGCIIVASYNNKGKYPNHHPIAIVNSNKLVLL